MKIRNWADCFGPGNRASDGNDSSILSVLLTSSLPVTPALFLIKKSFSQTHFCGVSFCPDHYTEICFTHSTTPNLKCFTLPSSASSLIQTHSMPSFYSPCSSRVIHFYWTCTCLLQLTPCLSFRGLGQLFERHWTSSNHWKAVQHHKYQQWCDHNLRVHIIT